MLTRLLDFEGFPADELAFSLDGYRDRLKVLFLGDDPECLRSGYTGHMMMLLTVHHPLMLASGVKSIGFATGTVDNAMISRCLSRMANWVYLTFGTLDAEFPHFETVQAWGVFNVTTSSRDTRVQAVSRGTQLQQLSRLKHVFRVEASVEDLEAQLDHFKPIARRVAQQRGLDSRDAWEVTTEMVRRTKRHDSPPFDALLSLLVRFWASGISSSGVEQTFAAQVAKAGVHLQGLDDSHLDDRTEILDIQDSEVAEVIKGAKLEWLAVYGVVRSSGSARECRVDKGCTKRKQSSDQQKLSENRWIKKRREDLSLAVERVAPSSVQVLPSVETWTDGHLKEVGFMASKRVVRLAESIMEGAQDDSSTSAEDLQAVVKYLEGKVKTDKNYISQKKREYRVRAGPVPIEILDANIHTTIDIAELPGFANACNQLRLTVHGDSCDASLFVVRDLTVISNRILWNASLIGGTVCTWDFIRLNAASGPSITYHAALASRRFIYMTDAFIISHERLCDLITRRMVSFPGCKWKMLSDAVDFRRRAMQNQNLCIALMSQAEQISEVSTTCANLI